MSIVWTRRISQGFFLVLFFGLCLTLTVGDDWGQWTGWPWNFFLQLDPLVALATVAATGVLYAGLAWAGVTLLLTLLFGRVFCGWLCPLGTLHQIVGWLGRRVLPRRMDRRRMNTPHPAQGIKYLLLAFLLAAAAGGFLRQVAAAPALGRAAVWLLAAGAVGLGAWRALRARGAARMRRAAAFVAALGLGLGLTPAVGPLLNGTLQTGLLDPIPLLHRSAHLILLPWADHAHGWLSTAPRHYVGAGVIGAFFLGILLLNLLRPRFYCRYLCPLGAMLGAMAPLSVFRPGKTRDDCSHCGRCEEHCEGACDPDGVLRLPECVACMNCLRACPDNVFAYRAAPSASGEARAPDPNRRGLLAATAAGLLAPAAARLSAWTGENWRWRMLRPPGALDEERFLQRCLKCGQCMRVCPTNIIQPAGMEAGIEGLWTPVLNYRIGTSGCQLDCTACGAVCPTAAIRPISLDEKRGRGDFEERGPVRMGTAFVDETRCLPWAKDTPCIVCEENCPVSPKAIFTRHEYRTVRGGRFRIASVDDATLHAGGAGWTPGAWATGDYVARPAGATGAGVTIGANDADSLTLIDTPEARAGEEWEVAVHLQKPVIDIQRCIGCGICEHECPVSGLRAIRVTAENESRNRAHSLQPGR
jgi:polyferredoxin/ferredoxin